MAEIGSEKVKFLPRKSSLLIWQIMLQLNQAWDEWVDSQNPPPSNGRSKLADPDWKVEIVIIAGLYKRCFSNVINCKERFRFSFTLNIEFKRRSNVCNHGTPEIWQAAVIGTCSWRNLQAIYYYV